MRTWLRRLLRFLRACCDRVRLRCGCCGAAAQKLFVAAAPAITQHRQCKTTCAHKREQGGRVFGRIDAAGLSLGHRGGYSEGNEETNTVQILHRAPWARPKAVDACVVLVGVKCTHKPSCLSHPLSRDVREEIDCNLRSTVQTLRSPCCSRDCGRSRSESPTTRSVEEAQA
jgi:hypothetical protein